MTDMHKANIDDCSVEYSVDTDSGTVDEITSVLATVNGWELNIIDALSPAQIQELADKIKAEVEELSASQ